jgi:hypothetical protein
MIPWSREADVTAAFDETMVAVTAAEMRRTLGLLPWPSWEARARDTVRAYLAAGGHPDPDPDRGTGRSTRGAILALARCRVEGLAVVHVEGGRHAVRLVKDLAASLRLRQFRLEVEVVCGDPDRWRGHPGGVLFHRDHHQEARSRRTGW